jgi:hypothetical protein
MKAMQYDRAYQLLSETDQDVLSLEDFLAYMEKRYGYMEDIKKESAVFYNFVQKGFFTFEVLSKRQQNGDVEYNIEIAFADHNTVAFLLHTALDMESPDITQEEKEQLFGKVIGHMYPDGNPPLLANMVTYRAVQEGGMWRLHT